MIEAVKDVIFGRRADNYFQVYNPLYWFHHAFAPRYGLTYEDRKFLRSLKISDPGDGGLPAQTTAAQKIYGSIKGVALLGAWSLVGYAVCHDVKQSMLEANKSVIKFAADQNTRAMKQSFSEEQAIADANAGHLYVPVRRDLQTGQYVVGLDIASLFHK